MDRRVVSRSEALGEGGEGYRSAGFDGSAAGAGSEVRSLSRWESPLRLRISA